MRAIPAPKLGEDILKAISRLKVDLDFQKLVEYLKELKSARAGAAITIPDDIHSRWAAGRAQELSELLDSIERCDVILKESKYIFKEPTEPTHDF